MIQNGQGSTLADDEEYWLQTKEAKYIYLSAAIRPKSQANDVCRRACTSQLSPGVDAFGA